MLFQVGQISDQFAITLTKTFHPQILTWNKSNGRQPGNCSLYLFILLLMFFILWLSGPGRMSHKAAMKVLGLQGGNRRSSSGGLKKLEDYTEDELLEAFNAEIDAKGKTKYVQFVNPLQSQNVQCKKNPKKG